MIDFECSIVDTLHWSLYDIDETDIESLLPFVMRFPKWKDEQKSNHKREKEQAAYADQLDL